MNRYTLFNFLFSALLVVLLSCDRTVENDAFRINGTLTGAGGEWIYLEELTVDRLIRIDSAVIGNNGEFAFERVPAETGFYLLRYGGDKTATLVMGKGDQLIFRAHRLTFPANYSVSGTTGSEILADYFRQTYQRQHIIDSLGKVFIDSRGAENFFAIRQSLDSAFRSVFGEHQDFTRNLITQNPGNMASLLLLNQRFTRQVMFRETNEPGLFILLDSALHINYPDNSHVIDHHARIEKILEQKNEKETAEKMLSPGKAAPEMTLPDISDKMISLSSLKGNIVLLSFWSSGCVPCRAINQQLKAIYQAYENKGFRIYAVSLDTQKKIWQGAVSVDELKWINVSDLAGIDSPVRKLYNLPENLPYFYLLNRNGEIIAKGFNIPELRELLSEHLK